MTFISWVCPVCESIVETHASVREVTCRGNGYQHKPVRMELDQKTEGGVESS